MFQPTNPENAAIIEKLYQKLCELSVGDTLAYLTLSQAAGKDVSSNGKNRHLLEAAREKAEKDLGCIFETVRSVGVKRLTADADRKSVV